MIHIIKKILTIINKSIKFSRKEIFSNFMKSYTKIKMNFQKGFFFFMKIINEMKFLSPLAIRIIFEQMNRSEKLNVKDSF